MTSEKGILIQNIYYMLAYAFQELRQNNYAEIAGENFEEIYDLFAEILARGISFQLKQGLHRDYIHRNESLNTLRGKIDLNETISLKSRKSNHIACEFDELSENNIYNRIIVSTVNILLKHSSVREKSKSALKRQMLFFSNVQPIEIKDIHWNTLRFDRNNRSYRMLLYICYFILDGLLMTTEDGKYKMREFSDDHMNRLFEKFVLEFYRRHHPSLKARAEQIKWNLDRDYSKNSENVLPIMQTDIMLSIGERTLIIDTKYYGQTMQQQFNKSTIHSNNLYQIHTYVTEHDLNGTGRVDGMLLYAKTQEGIVPDGQMKLARGNTISFRTLDLNQDFTGIKKSLDAFINKYDTTTGQPTKH